MAADAKRMPAREAEYRNLVLNQRIETTQSLYRSRCLVRVWRSSRIARRRAVVRRLRPFQLRPI